MEILSTRFGKSMIFTVFAMAKEEISSSETCMITISPLKSTIDDQISEMFRKVKITEGTFAELCTDRIVSTSFFVRSVLVCTKVERLPSRLSGGSV